MIAASLRCAKEHEQRADLAAEVANTSSGGGLVKSPKADFREAMRASCLFSEGNWRSGGMVENATMTQKGVFLEERTVRFLLRQCKQKSRAGQVPHVSHS
jgi:hypothetical protein